MSDSDDDYGPPLPPGYGEDSADAEPSSSDAPIGPLLPPHLRAAQSSTDNDADSNDVTSTDPADYAPSSNQNTADSSDDDDFIGPTLPGQSDSTRRYGTGHRADTSDSSEVQKREEWMTVVPKKMEKKMGVSFKSQTTFSKASARDDDREADTSRPTTSHQREESITSALEDYSKKKRSATLVDLHQDKLKKKRKEEGDDKPKGRAPLDFRIDDLGSQVKFDDRQKKSVMDKAKLLNTRFSKGASKYL